MSGTVASPTLPLATTSAFTPAGTRSPTSSDGWQGALERAILGSVHESATRSATAATPPAPQTEVPMSGPQYVRTARSVAAPETVAGLALPPLGLDAMEPVGSSSTPVDPLWPDVRQTDEDLSTDLPASRTGRRSASPSESHLRVHVEQHAEGLAVFLGVPGDTATVAAHTAALLLELRRQMQGLPQRLALVVCNGVPIHHTPPLPKEKP